MGTNAVGCYHCQRRGQRCVYPGGYNAAEFNAARMLVLLSVALRPCEVGITQDRRHHQYNALEAVALVVHDQVPVL